MDLAHTTIVETQTVKVVDLGVTTVRGLVLDLSYVIFLNAQLLERLMFTKQQQITKLTSHVYQCLTEKGGTIEGMLVSLHLEFLVRNGLVVTLTGMEWSNCKSFKLTNVVESRTNSFFFQNNFKFQQIKTLFRPGPWVSVLLIDIIIDLKSSGIQMVD